MKGCLSPPVDQIHTEHPGRRRMFERVYVNSRWHRSVAGDGLLASLAVHAFAGVALIVAGADPGAITREITEGIIFLAPLPSPAAGPSAPSEQLRFVALGSAIGAMAKESDLHAGSATPAQANEPDPSLGTQVETPASIFERPADSVYFAEQVDSPAAYDE